MRAWASASRGEPLTLGQPLAQVRLYVLDAQQEPVPAGVIGEGYIGGVGLARGYRGRAELTAERFVPDPWSGEPGARLYRTGDRLRWQGDGRLEFVGRVDRQIKLRGYRIELGEIEVVLREQEGGGRSGGAGVGASAGGQTPGRLPGTLRRASAGGGGCAGGGERAVAGVHAALLLRAVETVPPDEQWQSGSTSLARPEHEAGIAESEMVPRSPLEETLQAAWCEVLEMEQIGLHDNFFDAGGHSLLATVLIARLQALLQVEIPLQSLFDAPTIAGLRHKCRKSKRQAGRVTSAVAGGS